LLLPRTVLGVLGAYRITPQGYPVMSDIKISRAHSMPQHKARKEAEKIAEQLQEKFDLTYQWSGERINFSRQGVSGFLEVGQSEVRLEAKLGMLLGFLKPTIESHINENLDHVFGNATAGTKPAATKLAAKTAAKTTPKSARKS
jgi:putative polyhydroxyalkanoate system protein